MTLLAKTETLPILTVALYLARRKRRAQVTLDYHLAVRGHQVSSQPDSSHLEGLSPVTSLPYRYQNVASTAPNMTTASQRVSRDTLRLPHVNLTSSLRNGTCLSILSSNFVSAFPSRSFSYYPTTTLYDNLDGLFWSTCSSLYMSVFSSIHLFTTSSLTSFYSHSFTVLFYACGVVGSAQLLFKYFLFRPLCIYNVFFFKCCC